ncbi:MauE/DoxX family redox-associated membrane protein [Tumebacillus avium]|nr:MauE/DoxX family redox-associated membrane protein [Tumebacillus avium]
MIWFLRILLGTIFVSSFLEKIRKYEEHKSIIRDYRILPDRIVPYFSAIEVGLQLLTAALLYLGIFLPVAGMLSAILLAMYSIAVSMNLLKGRTEISCGCGGIVGNHQLSWGLIIRNVLLIACSSVIMTTNTTLGNFEAAFHGQPWGDIINASYFLTIFEALVTLVIWSAASKLLLIRKSLKTELIKGV